VYDTAMFACHTPPYQVEIPPAYSPLKETYHRNLSMNPRAFEAVAGWGAVPCWLRARSYRNLESLRDLRGYIGTWCMVYDTVVFGV